MTTAWIPVADGWQELVLQEPRDWVTHPAPFRRRAVFAAAHVVADPLGENVPGAPAVIDWDETLAFRRHLFSFGFGVAEAMDTAQRNMGLDYAAVTELVRRSAAQAAECGAEIASGAGTDQIAGPARDLGHVKDAYLEQVEMVEDAGSRVILMASRHLAAIATTAQDYRTVYDAVLARAAGPVILHWLGAVFDPALDGYWGSSDIDVATRTFLELVHDHADRIDGVKVSLLSAEHEIGLRAALPEGVRLYTGDDFHYPELIKGDGTHHSDALLGAFAAVAPAASAALTALDEDDVRRFDAEMAPTLPLSRAVFEHPTYHYKTGIAFLSWICGLQSGFSMVGGLQSARSVTHFGRLLTLANEAQLLPDPERALARYQSLLEIAGVHR